MTSDVTLDVEDKGTAFPRRRGLPGLKLFAKGVQLDGLFTRNDSGEEVGN